MKHDYARKFASIIFALLLISMSFPALLFPTSAFAEIIDENEPEETEETLTCNNIITIAGQKAPANAIDASIIPQTPGYSADNIKVINPNDSESGSLDTPGNTYPRPGDYGEVTVKAGTTITWTDPNNPMTFTKENYGGLGTTKTYDVTTVSVSPYGKSIGNTYYPAGSPSEYVWALTSGARTDRIGFEFKGIKATPANTPVYCYYKITIRGKAADGDEAVTIKNVGFKVTVTEDTPDTYQGALGYDPNGGTLKDPALKPYSWKSTDGTTYANTNYAAIQTTSKKPLYMDFEITNVIPSRDGYKFLFWAAPDFNTATTSYKLLYRGAKTTPPRSSPIRFGLYESTYSIKNDANEDVCSMPPILKAVWDKEYSLRYDGAGGNPMPPGTRANEEGTFGINNQAEPETTEKTFTVLNGPTRDGYTFKGWQGSNGKTYMPGDSVSVTYDEPNLELTALWEESTPDPGEGGSSGENPNNPDDGDNPSDGGDPNNGSPDNPGEDPSSHNPGNNSGNNPSGNSDNGSGSDGNNSNSNEVDSEHDASSGSNDTNGAKGQTHKALGKDQKSSLPQTSDSTLQAIPFVAGIGLLAGIVAAVAAARSRKQELQARKH